jgi:hypothetical protein
VISVAAGGGGRHGHLADGPWRVRLAHEASIRKRPSSTIRDRPARGPWRHRCRLSMIAFTDAIGIRLLILRQLSFGPCGGGPCSLEQSGSLRWADDLHCRPAPPSSSPVAAVPAL